MAASAAILFFASRSVDNLFSRHSHEGGNP